MKTRGFCHATWTSEIPAGSHLNPCALAVCATMLLGGCEGIQSVLDPHGPDAERIATLSWILSGGAAAIFVLVMVLTLLALVRPPQRDWFGSSKLIVAGGLVFPVITLTALLVYTLVVAEAMTEPGEDAVEIEVTGYQWWWDVRYLDRNGEVVFTTANEIRIPVGRPARARVATADVIHSFWVPNLAGKMDMLPGHVHELPFQAEAPGTFRGQCAEYCGGPHAWMAFHVMAEEPEQFARWFEGQREPAREPTTPFLQRGRELFVSHGCGACHAIRGTEADGRLGPDLTHVGSRLSIGAGVLDNHVGTLEAWIANSQRIKPQNRMPPFDTVEGEDLRAIAAYLESLK